MLSCCCMQEDPVVYLAASDGFWMLPAYYGLVVSSYNENCCNQLLFSWCNWEKLLLHHLFLFFFFPSWWLTWKLTSQLVLELKGTSTWQTNSGEMESSWRKIPVWNSFSEDCQSACKKKSAIYGLNNCDFSLQFVSFFNFKDNRSRLCIISMVI